MDICAGKTAQEDVGVALVGVEDENNADNDRGCAQCPSVSSFRARTPAIARCALALLSISSAGAPSGDDEVVANLGLLLSNSNFSSVSYQCMLLQSRPSKQPSNIA